MPVRVFRPVTALLLAGAACLSPAAHAFAISISADTAQTMEGFGVSSAWSGMEIMGLPQAERDRALRMFFTGDGAGASIVRIRLVPPDGAEFASQVEFCLQAKALGVTRFYATVWEVPDGFLDAGRKLLPARFDAYAGHIAGFLRQMEQQGVRVGWVGVQNEPDNGPKLASSWTVDYNKYTVHFYRSKAELRDFSVALKRHLAAAGLGAVRLLGPECMGWEGTRELIKAQFETAEGRAALDIVAAHDYWGAERDADMNPVRQEVAALARAQGKRVWQTEYSRFDCVPGCSDACQQAHVAQDPARLLSDAAFSMQDGLDMAQYVYRDIAFANASAWLYWWTHNPNKGCGNAAQGQVGMHNSFNGMALIKEDRTFHFPKRFHVLSHYMRFVGPGSVRLKLATDGEDALRPLAFRDSAGSKVTLVLYNRGSAAAPVSASLPGFPGFNAVKPWLTAEAADRNVAPGTAAAFTAGAAHAFELPPRSIATLVFERSTPSSLAAPLSTAQKGPGRRRAWRYAAGKDGKAGVRTLEGRRVPASEGK